MNDYEKTIAVLQDRVRALEERLTPCNGAVAKPKKWSPVGGNWWIRFIGDVVCNGDSTPYSREFGTERQTCEQAKRAAVEMRKFNRLLALRDELCGDDAELGMYHVIFQNRDGTYFIGYSEQQNNEIGSVRFTTKESAQRACEMLNSGEVEL
jgi:hypothetical protein